MSYTPQQTIRYKTYIKHALVEALRDVFQNHPDPDLRKTKVGIDFSRKEAEYPLVVVRFFEKTADNAGVGHYEKIDVFDLDTDEFLGRIKLKHFLYWGDIEFGVYALSSLDRDLIADSLVQTVGMGELESYTNRFLMRVYANPEFYPDAVNHFIAVNTDSIQGFGETQSQTPWFSEDDLVYTTSYRVKVFGEFYSLPNDTPKGFIEAVRQYPYIDGVEAVPTGDPNEGNGWSS
jgi:hypothetical protein